MGESTRDDDKAETALVVAVVKPPKLVDPIQAVIDMVNTSAVAIGSVNFKAGMAVRALAVAAGWVFNQHKAERAQATLHAVVQRLEQTRSEYVRREEFADLLEEALRRVADQPDPERRAALRNVILKVMEEPADHVRNRRFVRLADELSMPAWKILGALDSIKPGAHGGRGLQNVESLLAMSAGLPDHDLIDAMEDLATERLLDRSKLGVQPSPAEYESLSFILTRTGRAFLTYTRG